MSSEPTILQRRYRLDRLLGVGGFARVYLATDLQLNRQVAVKVLNADLVLTAPDHDFRARFKQEAQMVAVLDHPNILGIYDYGETEETVFLVMPFIEGGTLDERLKESGRLGAGEAAKYLTQAAAALDYAHRRGLVHRDIKPQNMLLRAEDDRLLLADFGIAKLVQGTPVVQSQSALVGTPHYMAPEQFEGKISPAVDIYALGCMLFQLLTGKMPYGGPAQEVMYGHLVRPIPSIVERSDRQVPEKIQAIVERALAKKPEERFQSAGALAAALTAALRDEPTDLIAVHAPVPAAGSDAGTIEVKANTEFKTALLPEAEAKTELGTSRPAGGRSLIAAGQGRKAGWLPVIGGASAVVALVLVVVLLSNLVFRGTGGTPGQATAVLGANPGITPTVLPTATVPEGTPVLGSTPMPGGTPLSAGTPGTPLQQGATPRASATPGAATPVAAVPTAAPTPTMIPGVFEGKQLTTIPGIPGPIIDMAWAPDGQTLATSGRDGTIRLWTAEGLLRTNLYGHTSSVYGLAWSHDGSILASASGDGTVRLWDANTAKTRTVIDTPQGSNRLAWSPTNQTLAFFVGPSAQLWDTAGKLQATLQGHLGSSYLLAWSPDGRFIATGSDDGANSTVRLWNANGSSRAILKDHAAAILALAWSPDSQTLSSAAKDKTIRLWTVDGTLRATLPNPATEVDAVDLLAWAPDGQTLASADGPFIRFYTQEGEVRTSFRVMGTRIYAVAWSPDSQTFASAENGGVIKLWASDGKQLSSWQDNPSYIGEIAWSPNGQYLVALGGDGARFWTNEGVLQAALVDHKAPVDQVSWSPDGRTIVSSNALGLIRFWNANGSARATSEPPKSSMGKLTWSPNGQILAVGTYQEVWLWNSEGKQIATLKGHQGFAFTIAWSPNSQFLATRDETGKLLLWDATFKQCATMPSPSSTENGSGIGYLSWAPDSQSLLSLVKEGAKIWNIDGSLRATLAGKIYAPVAWSPDGSVIASGSEKGLAFWSPDGTLQRLNENMHIGSLYWSPDGQLLAVNTYLNGVPSGVQLLTAEGKTVTTLDIPPKLVSTTAIMQWSPDGAYIAFGSVADRLVRIWNRDGSPKATLDQHQSGITGLSWSPDSRLIVSSSLDGSIRIWR